MKENKTGIRERSGFTLAETLMAVLILLLVTAIVAGGMPVAVNSLEKSVDGSHAQVLLSTTMTALRDELTTAKDVKVSGTTISYTDGSGLRSEIKIKDDHKIWLVKAKSYLPEDTALTTEGTGLNAIERLLVSDQAATDMIVSYSGVERNGAVLSFTGLSVTKDNKQIAVLGTDGNKYEIRVVSYKD